jgi:hypothetical protein
LSFFDEGDEPGTVIRSPQPQPRRPTDRGRRSHADDRTLLLRRGAAAGVVLIVVIGLVLGIKAILDHQALQGLKDYNNKVSALVTSEQASVQQPFFTETANAPNSPNPTEVPTTLQQYVQQERAFYLDAQSWSVPAQVVGAQRQFVQALGLRYEALQRIASAMSLVLGVSSDPGAQIKLISGDMEMLLTSDVIYAERVAPLITQALARAGISGQTTPPSAFLPDITWIEPPSVAQRILGYVPTSLGGAPATGSNGHELTTVSITGPTGSATPLQSGSGTIYRDPYTSAGFTFLLTIKNSGTGNVHGVMTKIFFSKAGLNTSCLTTPAPAIPLTRPGLSYTSSIVFAPSLSCISAFFNQPLLMTAEVHPVAGETDTTNNFQHFLIEFTH